MSALTTHNQYLRGLHVPPTPPHSRLGDDVAEALTDQQDGNRGQQHSVCLLFLPCIAIASHLHLPFSS